MDENSNPEQELFLDAVLESDMTVEQKLHWAKACADDYYERLQAAETANTTLTRERDEARTQAERDRQVAARKQNDTERWYGVRWSRLRLLLDGTELEEQACAIMANGTASVYEPPRQYVPESDLRVVVQRAEAAERERDEATEHERLTRYAYRTAMDNQQREILELRQRAETAERERDEARREVERLREALEQSLSALSRVIRHYDDPDTCIGIPTIAYCRDTLAVIASALNSAADSALPANVPNEGQIEGQKESE